MSLSRIPLPSISLVLASDEAIFPGPKKFEAEASVRTSSSIPAHLMKTIDLRNEASFEAVQFSYHHSDDLATDDGHEDTSDTKTIFKGKRPGTSRGFRSDRASSYKIKHTVTLIMSACRRFMPVKTTQSTLRKAAQY
ncbi:hypothetical protein GALMADRAFT_152855 [Galerina marginata CBS 339.88]|uniref:Uncharacterized protein n=1 Tax=Galerina marginata (strain CBS 339.88) TaxID=685588 RepID=A0A067TIA6_GALM3|nr:hypothetical protein GALMADRAFT_152855 [Galerina marginata CBS 339.88]